MVGLAPKWVKLNPKLDKSGLFQIRFQYIWLIDPIKKVPDLSNLGSNLTHFGGNPTIPGSKSHKSPALRWLVAQKYKKSETFN